MTARWADLDAAFDRKADPDPDPAEVVAHLKAKINGEEDSDESI